MNGTAIQAIGLLPPYVSAQPAARWTTGLLIAAGATAGAFLIWLYQARVNLRAFGGGAAALGTLLVRSTTEAQDEKWEHVRRAVDSADALG